ncbi:MAG: hypothetical protein MJ054_01980, partial [Clostridia bacterium]|nr:hypothetical protein [Clostridia bacterium]
YQGKVILPSTNETHRPQRHKALGIITSSIMALAVAVTGSLLGVMTLHNQELKHQVQALETQATTTSTKPQETHNQQQKSNKVLRRIPISDQQHETQPMPSIN